MNMLLIKNGRIFTMNKNDDIIENGCILIEDGKIKRIDKDIKVCENVEVIDATGKNIYPGFVEAHSHLGLSEDSIGALGRDHNETSDPITPHLRAIDGMYPQDVTIEEAYSNGVTTAVICPGSANIVGGKCSAIKLYGNRIDNMILKEDVAMKVAFGENPKVHYGNKGKAPATRMGIAGMLRETLLKTIEYRDTKKEKKIPLNMKYEAMIPVVNGEMPIKVHAHREDDIFTAIRIAKEFNLKMTMDHCTSGLNIADDLAKENYPAIVGPSLGHRGKFELKSKSYKGPNVLFNAGIKIAITTDSPVVPLQYLPLCAGLAAAEGLCEYEALKAITINPAEIIGIDDRVGSLEIGKDADIIITEKDPIVFINFGLETTIIDGKVIFQKQ